jgi:hypothetical protein
MKSCLTLGPLLLIATSYCTADTRGGATMRLWTGGRTELFMWAGVYSNALRVAAEWESDSRALKSGIQQAVIGWAGGA